MSEILILALLLISSFFLSGFVRFLMLKRNWFDEPNSRSSHGRPTPNSGGLAFVLCFFSAVLYLFFIDLLPANEFIALCMGLFVAALGFMDDIWNMNITGRIGVHFISAIVVLISLGGLPELPVFSLLIDFGWLGYPIGVLGIVWSINLYNFMDGIDGMAALEACFVCAAAISFAVLQNFPNDALLLQCLLASILGFLFWNLPTAKIFMGDVGSNFLGLILAVLGLVTISHGLMNIWTWAILLGVFIVDSTLTLIRRIRVGEIWYYAHRSHAYQHAALRHSSHGKVDLVVILINCFWLFPLAWVTVINVEWAILTTVVAYIPMLVLGFYYKAGV